MIGKHSYRLFWMLFLNFKIDFWQLITFIRSQLYFRLKTDNSNTCLFENSIMLENLISATCVNINQTEKRGSRRLHISLHIKFCLTNIYKKRRICIWKKEMHQNRIRTSFTGLNRFKTSFKISIIYVAYSNTFFLIHV
jgi:hypothetical protein